MVQSPTFSPNSETFLSTISLNAFAIGSYNAASFADFVESDKLIAGFQKVIGCPVS